MEFGTKQELKASFQVTFYKSSAKSKYTQKYSIFSLRSTNSLHKLPIKENQHDKLSQQYFQHAMHS